mgnify:CR=1 FL=1|tara:strand:+ start:198 stop:470 length:273 start_codon:yes stop_codon:yes gene_type:complete
MSDVVEGRFRRVEQQNTDFVPDQRTPAVLGKIQKSAAVVVIGFIYFYFYKQEKYSLVSLGQALRAVSIGAALGIAAGVSCSNKNIPRNSS